MSFFDAIRYRLRSLLKRGAHQADVDEEFRFHLDLEQMHQGHAGAKPDEAGLAARKRFGRITQHREEVRRLTGVEVLDAVVRSVRQASRNLRRSAGYSAAVVILLALGIGSTVAVVSVVERVLLRPLPFPEPERLVSLFETTPDGAFRLASYPTVRDWQADNQVFERMAYVHGNRIPMRGDAGPELLTAAYPTGEFFPMLGADAVFGRVLTPDDDRGAARVVVLSHRLWQGRFGGDPAIIGRVLPLAGGGATVVGVMPRAFRLPEWADLWMPFGAMPAGDRAIIEKRGNHADSRVLGRLRRGVSLVQAEQAMTLIAGRLAEVYPVEQKDWPKVSLMRLEQYLALMTTGSQAEDRAPRLGLFLVGSLLVLLVAVANVATLTLARGSARGQELAVRAALGASRTRLASQLVLETGLLTAAGSALGIWLAMTAVSAIQRANPDLLPRLLEVELDFRLALLAVAIGVATTIGAGLWPALAATARPVHQALTAEGNRSGLAPSRRRVQRILVTGQVMVATVLLIGAGVMLRSFRQAVVQPPGFEPVGLASVSIQPPELYRTPERTLELYRRLERDVAALPEVQGVALTGGTLPSNVTMPGRTPDPSRPDMAGLRTVTPSYFQVMGIPIVQGTGFTEDDLAGPNGRLVVNQAFVRQYWPDQDPIGRQLSIAKAARWLPDLGQPVVGTVVGVVRDVRQQESDASPEVYLPYTWNLWQWMTMEVRARGNVEAMREPVRRALLAVEPDLPMAASSGRLGFLTYEEQLSDGRASRRLTTVAIGALSGLTLLLAAFGLYAVVAYSVTRRRREIGIRLALGSERRKVLGLVLHEGFGVTAVGLGLGLVAGWFGVSLLQSLVFGIDARDPLTFALVPGVLGLVAGLAVAIPAKRAAAVPPAEALRS